MPQRSDSALVEPAYKSAPEYSETLGPEVADLCDLVGFTPDPEQELALDLIFALNSDGKSAAFEIAEVAARQNLKTGSFKQATLGWLFVVPQRLIVWSAHEFSTTKEAMRDLDELIQGNRHLAKRWKTTRYSNEDPSIELKTGQRIKFKARTKTGGRGLTGDKIVMDEAFALVDDHLDALMPTLSARPDPQILYGSQAGLSYSAVLQKLRDRGRAGDSSRLAYLEWCAGREPCESPECDHQFGRDGCVLDDQKLWKLANPLLGRTRANGTGLTYEHVQSERESLSPQGFARERMGWWDDPADAEPAFGQGFWEACAVEEDPPGTPGALAVAVSFDLTHGSVGAAARDGDVKHVKPLQHGPGTGWVVQRAKTLQDQFDGVAVVIDERGPAAMLIPALEEAGVKLVKLDTRQVLDACAGLFDAVRDRGVRHRSYLELDTAVAGAVKRPVGDRWAWGRRKSSTDISPLESITFATYGLDVEPDEPDPEPRIRTIGA